MTGQGNTETRQVYVWRLVVTLPEGSDEPGWEPEEWDGYKYGDESPDRRFVWPRRRLYLNGAAAGQRAALLRSWGAEVVMERSAAVTWEVSS